VVLVDTSVWIDFLNTYSSPYAGVLSELIREHNRVVICGVILQEILQGIKDEGMYKSTREKLCRLPFIDTHKSTYLFASDLYRKLRNKGIAIPPVDVLIAAITMTNDLILFTKDTHFKELNRVAGLRLLDI